MHSFAVPSFSKKIIPRMYINVYNISYLNLLSHTFPWNPESGSVPLSKRKMASAPRFPGESDLDLAHFPAYGIATTDHIPDAQVRRSTVNAMITRSSPWWNDEGLPENTWTTWWSIISCHVSICFHMFPPFFNMLPKKTPAMFGAYPWSFWNVLNRVGPFCPDWSGWRILFRMRLHACNM